MKVIQIGRGANRTDSAPSIVPVEVECVMCQKFITLHVPRVGYENWIHGGVFIQDALPSLSAGERELLISKTCEPCFDKLFGGER
jgi:hypothetical protein